MTSSFSPVTTLAKAVKELLTAEDTPPILRDRLAYCVSELRDALAPDAAKRLDGIEAEAVIIAFAESDAPALAPSSDAKSLP